MAKQEVEKLILFLEASPNSSASNRVSFLGAFTIYLTTLRKIQTRPSSVLQYRSLKFIWSKFLTCSCNRPQVRKTCAMPQPLRSDQPQPGTRAQAVLSYRLERTLKLVYLCTVSLKSTSRQKSNYCSMSRRVLSAGPLTKPV